MISKDTEVQHNLQKKDAFCQAGDSFCENVAPKGWDKTTFLDPSMIDFEKDMKDSLLGKVMENFEKTMMKETKKFDEMKREIDQKQVMLDKTQNSQHIPSTLRNEGADIRDLWQRVNSLILDPFAEEPGLVRKASMKNLTPETYQMILSHGIGAWLSTLNQDHFDKLTQKIYSDTSQWISKIWRFRCSASLFHQKLYDGILNVCKVALATHYPKYQTDGYNALYSHPPVIYINNAVDQSLKDFLRINLGLPTDSISLVPNNLELGGDESMDIIALEQLILADLSADKMPLIICAYAGSPNTGSMDRLNDIHDLCKAHKIWLHIEGFKLSQLALLHVPAKFNTISSKVKSMTLDVGSWLGIPSVPYITLVMTKVPDTFLKSLGFGPGYFLHNRAAMDIFPLWLSLQLIGHDGIVHKLEGQARQSHSIIKHLTEITNIQLVSRELSKRAKTGKTTSVAAAAAAAGKESGVIKNLMDTVLAFLLEGHLAPFVIVFLYNPYKRMERSNGTDKAGADMVNGAVNCQSQTLVRKPRFVTSEDGESELYLNSLNQWLADNLVANYPQMNIRLINLPSEGMCLRLCVQENNISQDMCEDLLQSFYGSVRHHVAIMNATVNQRTLFRDIVMTKSQLLLIDLPSWAGLGCVLFVPEFYRGDLSKMSSMGEIGFDNEELLHFLSVPHHVSDINKVNKILIDELRKDDEAFSLGIYHCSTFKHAPEEKCALVCVRFGLITETTMLEQLVDLVIDKGDRVESSTRSLEKFSQLVKEGIDKVVEELAREHEEKLRQDGVLRQVPYIDSIINWWYPADKNQIKGRSLHLSSGEIHLTDDTYKYKMQLLAGPQAVFSFNTEAGNIVADAP